MRAGNEMKWWEIVIGVLCHAMSHRISSAVASTDPSIMQKVMDCKKSVVGESDETTVGSARDQQRFGKHRAIPLVSDSVAERWNIIEN